MNAGQLIRFFLISVLFSISLGSTPPGAEAWQTVSAGGWHTCALRNDGTVACWGYNQDGQATPRGARSRRWMLANTIPVVSEMVSPWPVGGIIFMVKRRLPCPSWPLHR